MKNFFKLGILLFCLFSNNYGQNNLTEQDILVLEEPCDRMMKSYLANITDRQFAFRDSILSTLKSRRDWDIWSQTIRDSMISWTGPLPGRTALNARITGRLERKDYIVEKILFESRPDYFVSANLYLPQNITGPLPAHLNVIGHAQIGKADERYQRMSVAQVKNGFVVLTIDQLGQGERGMLSSHRIIGTQAFLSGTHLFNYMVWDVIRAIDYLASRPEVDASKIGVTGSSGGGMMTTYLLPLILKKFDMPQIYQALSPRSVSVINPLLGDKTPASEKDYKVIDRPVANTYVGLSNQDAWRITDMSDEAREEYLLSLFN